MEITTKHLDTLLQQRDRDTIESFGVDGQFAIYKCIGKELDLFDAKNEHSIDMISDYKEIEPYVYTIGKKRLY